MDGIKVGNFVAHDERSERDNFHTSIYEEGYDGLLICRCNQNGLYPLQVAAILNGLAERHPKPLPVDMHKFNPARQDG